MYSQRSSKCRIISPWGEGERSEQRSEGNARIPDSRPVTNRREGELPWRVLTLNISQKDPRSSGLGGSSRTGGDEGIYRAELFESSRKAEKEDEKGGAKSLIC